MSEFWSGTIGAVVGGFVSIGTTVAIDCIRERRTGKLDNIRTEILRRYLSDKRFEWRTLETLSDVIGADRETTIRLLLLMKARKSQKTGQDLWSLLPLSDEER